jgi:hypothetical protein
MMLEPINDDWQFTTREALVKSVVDRRKRLQPVPVPRAVVVTPPPPEPVVAPVVKHLASVSILTLQDHDPDRILSFAFGDIIETVAKYFDLPVEDVRSHRRTTQLKEARHICFYMARLHTKLSYPAIGKMFGGFDHTTCIFGATRIRNNLALYGPIIDKITEILASHG